MKTLFYILTLLICTNSYSQFGKLQGRWISSPQELIIIADTAKSFNRNYLSNALLRDQNFELALIGDTLSFRNTSYSVSNINRVASISRHDLKIIKRTDSTLELEPVSLLSKNFFQGKNRLFFTKQEFAVDTSIHFEKIVFQSSRFMGSFPVYHIQIDKAKSVLLNTSIIYKKENHETDSSSESNFKGQLSDVLFNKLLLAIKTCNLRTLRMSKELCCDGVLTTIIVYFNGERKYFKTMFPPKIASELIKTLFDICEQATLTKTDEKLKFEE